MNRVSTKPFASLSLDLDNQWSYMKTRGDPGWEKFPSYFDIFLPSFLDLLDELGLKITFFIVGQDAALDKNRDALKELIRRGHEVGNHSFHHEPWLDLYSKEQIGVEVLETEKHIIKVTGKKPIGFRGPGFSFNSKLFETLFENNYMFDTSTFPTYLGPFARKYYFKTASLTEGEKNLRKGLFGGFKEGLKPIKPYFLRLPTGDMFLEIPVTTIPLLRIPFHLSYLIYISRLSKRLMFFYLDMALLLCKITRTRPSFLLHPLDFLDASQIPELTFFPGMDIDRDQKIKIFKRVLKTISNHFNLVEMSAFAKAIIEDIRIK